MQLLEFIDRRGLCRFSGCFRLTAITVGKKKSAASINIRKIPITPIPFMSHPSFN